MKPLFIGGPLDGKRLQVARGATTYEVKGAATRTVYRREPLAIAGKVFELFVYDRLGLTEAIELLLDVYYQVGSIPDSLEKKA